MSPSQIPSKKTKIVCTIGPASASPKVLKQMIVNGMNIARINFAHGDHDGHRAVIKTIRSVSEETGLPITIFGDLPGPKMRIGMLEEEPIELEQGKNFILQTDEIVGNHRARLHEFRQAAGSGRTRR